MRVEKIYAVAALVAASNIGGTAAHAALYSYVGGRYLWNRATINAGQANLEFTLAFQSICSEAGKSKNDERNQTTACHGGTVNRPERKFLPIDDEPEI